MTATIRPGPRRVHGACDHHEGPGHCCAYVDAVNRLTRRATAEADDALGVKFRGGTLAEWRAWAWAWDRVYTRAMTRLTAQAGLRREVEE